MRVSLFARTDSYNLPLSVLAGGRTTDEASSSVMSMAESDSQNRTIVTAGFATTMKRGPKRNELRILHSDSFSLSYQFFSFS